MLLMIVPLPALAATKASPQTLIGSFGGWRAYTFKENGNSVCYMTLEAPKPAAAKRGTPRLTITHRPADSSKDVFTYAGGYNFKPASSVTIHSGKASFDLFTQGDSAWARDAATDGTLAKAIRNNQTLTATGIPAIKGAKPVTDRFTLIGAEAAYQAINKACGYPDDAPSKAKTPAQIRKVKPATAH